MVSRTAVQYYNGSGVAIGRPPERRRQGYCPRPGCGAMPGQSCWGTRGNGEGAYPVRLKTEHKERRQQRAAS